MTSLFGIVELLDPDFDNDVEDAPYPTGATSLGEATSEARAKPKPREQSKGPASNLHLRDFGDPVFLEWAKTNPETVVVSRRLPEVIAAIKAFLHHASMEMSGDLFVAQMLNIQATPLDQASLLIEAFEWIKRIEHHA
jgi:hypothetical protein